MGHRRVEHDHRQQWKINLQEREMEGKLHRAFDDDNKQKRGKNTRITVN